jgi:hypothetical protein
MSSSATGVFIVPGIQKPGIYIQNDSGGYWCATIEQASAFKNFPRYAYSGMGSSYWIGNTKAKENVRGKHHTYDMVYDSTNFWLRTSDGKMRHIMEIKPPPKPPK